MTRDELIDRSVRAAMHSSPGAALVLPRLSAVDGPGAFAFTVNTRAGPVRLLALGAGASGKMVFDAIDLVRHYFRLSLQLQKAGVL